MWGSLRGSCAWVCFAAGRGAGLRPQFSCSFVDSPLAGRPLILCTLLLTAVEFAQTVCFRYVLHDLIFQPLPNLSVKGLDRFEVHRTVSFPSSFRRASPRLQDYLLVRFGKQAVSPGKKRPSTGGVAGLDPNLLPSDPAPKHGGSARL